MMGCKNCTKKGGMLFLLFGIIFLLKDFGVWGFWGINWWTVLFILWGVGKWGMTTCPDCCAGMPSRGKK